MSILKPLSIDSNHEDLYLPERYTYVADAIANILTPERGFAVIESHHKYLALEKIKGTYQQRRPARLAYMSWCKTQREVRGDFATSLGWDSDRPFSMRQLAEGRWCPSQDDERWMYDSSKPSAAWDHIEFFRLGRDPVAVISHVYDSSFANCEAFAAEHGVLFKALPWSWYCPGSDGALAGLYLAHNGSASDDQF